MKKIAFLVIFLASLIIINNLVRSIYSLWKKQDLLVLTKEELVLEKRKHDLLEQKWRKVNDPKFVEQEARNKLFYVKSGEQVVVLPDSVQAEKEKEKQPQKEKKSNVEQWVAFFWAVTEKRW